jgi:hypothetical protein
MRRSSDSARSVLSEEWFVIVNAAPNFAAVIVALLATASAVEAAPQSRAKGGREVADDPAALFGQECAEAFEAVGAGSKTGADANAAVSDALQRATEALLAEIAPAPAPEENESGRARTKPPRLSRSVKAKALTTKLKDLLNTLTQDAAAWQLSRLITSVVASEQPAVASEFLAHPRFAKTLALVVEPESEEPARVVRLARSLMAQRSAQVERYPELAAAVAVVLDVPLIVQVNENAAHGADPLAVFDHFVANERRMFFGLRGIAPELLVYVVDVAASPDELAWATTQFAGHPAVGDLYDRVEYDFDYLEKGGQKRVTAAGWNLRNILRFGGICADQAYFATTVGKAIGVLSHAWIGYVASAGRAPRWAETGRFGAYQGVEGMIRDPQSLQGVSNTQMPMLVQFGIEPAQDRAYAAALRIAARRLLGDPKSVTAADPLTVSHALDLTRLAVRACVTDPRSWALVPLAARTGAMTTDQMRTWSSDILELCGESYPEYALRTIAPMIDAIPDPVQRHAALDGALEIFSGRGDLSGQILLKQADLYERDGDLAAAGRCYEAILSRYANDGPFAITALQRASAILGTVNDVSGNVTLHDRAFRSMEVPEGIAPQFARQSNWYRSGLQLAQALRIAGRERDAQLLEQRMSLKIR